MRHFLAWVRGLPFLLLLVSGHASAHKPSDSYLTLSSSGRTVSGRWDLALRDLDEVVGLDADGDGNVTWAELKKSSPEIESACLGRLRLSSPAGPCATALDQLRVVQHSDGTYAALDLHFTCPGDTTRVTLRDDFLFDFDADHRAVVRTEGAERPLLLLASARETVIDFVQGNGSFGAIVWLGALHIWGGFDHVLFLLALLLPAVLRRGSDRWTPVATFKPTLLEVLRVVTAFTVAHSITLGLASFGLVTLPSRLVESAIALSVVLAAVNNVVPMIGNDRWVAAFALGLLHGFGFAAALGDSGLEGGSLGRTLFGFNLGVELGQLAIVVVFLPVVYQLRRRPLYVRWVLTGGSLAVAAVASVWLVERAFDLSLIS